MSKSRISVLVPTKDEAETLPECLESVESIADEIIVLDGYSEDDTVSIAQSFKNVRVEQSSFEGFGELRRHLLSLASHEWVLFLDADEVLTDGLRAEIGELVTSGDDRAYRLPRKSQIFGTWMFEPGEGPLRLARRSDIEIDGSEYVHERINTGSRVESTQNHLLHYNYESMTEYIQKMNQYTSLEALERVESETDDSLLLASVRAAKMLVYYLLMKKTIRKGVPGIAYAVMSANYELIAYFKYEELTELRREKPDAWRSSWLSSSSR